MRGLSIGQISERTGLAVSAIRYYEDQGLVFPVRRSGGQRQFARADLRRLSFVMVAQEPGFSLAQIRAALAHLPEHRAPSKSDWARISKRFRRDLDTRIARMQRLRDRLETCIGCGCLSLDACHLYNPEDRAARKGPGAVYVTGDPDSPA